ncbi:MAG TPA: dienelactone hydrolase family protein [Bryobacteraceae bacterium]|nr:dienelactone hydrolase family protein [Bryobacteraceae bacterium]
MRTETLAYDESGKALSGFIAWNESLSLPLPGILVFHENVGLSDHEKERATRLAEMGYVALACDMFGERVAHASDEERRAAFEEFRRKKLLPRAQAGLRALTARPEVDHTRIGAIGFCLGGMVALELARSGADLKGIVSFHGGLATTGSAVRGEFKAKVLVCHGALDPFVTLEHVKAFADEMQNTGTDWQVNIYGGAMHGFTNPAADQFGRPGVAYNKEADERSWAAMKQLFAESFGS